MKYHNHKQMGLGNKPEKLVDYAQKLDLQQTPPQESEESETTSFEFPILSRE